MSFVGNESYRTQICLFFIGKKSKKIELALPITNELE